MLKIILIVTALCPLLAYSASEHSMLLTDSEREWIKRHPSVLYTVPELWPQEFEEQGIHKGLSREVLNDVEVKTGLRFVYVFPKEAMLERPMLISAVN